jgi:hypothetical protein
MWPAVMAFDLIGVFSPLPSTPMSLASPDVFYNAAEMSV